VHRVGQFVGHLTARVGPAEAEAAHQLLPEGAWGLFDQMPAADRRHALDVVNRLRSAGRSDPDLLAAALLHDCAKGSRMQLWHRVAGVLLGAGAPRLLDRLASPREASWRHGLYLYLHHTRLSAAAARRAGCPQRVADFIAGSAAPADAALAASLHVADEAS
jgi:hypothetical protein